MAQRLTGAVCHHADAPRKDRDLRLGDATGRAVDF
jgi:hypothetical protein